MATSTTQADQDLDLVIVDAILYDSPIAYPPNVADRKLNTLASSGKSPSRSYYRPSVCAEEYTFNNHYVIALDELVHIPVQIGKGLFETARKSQRSFDTANSPDCCIDMDYVICHNLTVAIYLTLRYVCVMLLDELGKFSSSHC